MAIRAATIETTRTIVDLRELDFCDSSGLALLLHARRRHPSLTILPGGSLTRLAKMARVEAQLFGVEAAPVANNGRSATEVRPGRTGGAIEGRHA